MSHSELIVSAKERTEVLLNILHQVCYSQVTSEFVISHVRSIRRRMERLETTTDYPLNPAPRTGPALSLDEGKEVLRVTDELRKIWGNVAGATSSVQRRRLAEVLDAIYSLEAIAERAISTEEA